MMSCRRRLLQSQGNEEKFLKYWWSADDDLVGGVWYDRIGSGINWTVSGDVKKENGLYVTNGNEGYFYFDDYNNILDLGYHFKIMFEGEIKYKRANTLNNVSIIDFGSIINSKKNIGFTCGTKGLSINWKMQGNNSGADIGITVDNLSKQVGGINYETFTSGIFEWGIRDKGNGYDEVYVAYNDDIGVFNADIPKIQYKDFNVIKYYISRGVSSNYYNIYYDSILRIKNIKIYVYD